MSRLTRPVAWAMAAVALAASVVAAVVIAVAAGRGIPDAPNAWEGLPLVVGVGAPACVGLVLLLRRPGTRVAWILLAGALSVALVMAAYAVGSLALDDDPGSSPGAWALVLAQEWVVLFLWPLALAYLFPDGRLPSPRWRLPAALALASGAGALLLLPLQPSFEGPEGDVTNPLTGGAGLDFLAPVFWACWFGLLLSLFGGALALRARYRVGNREHRRQVLWLAYGAVLPPLWLGGTSLVSLTTCAAPSTAAPSPTAPATRRSAARCCASTAWRSSAPSAAGRAARWSATRRSRAARTTSSSSAGADVSPRPGR